MAFPDNLPCEAILDSIADGVFTVDLEWTITSFNRAATQITGIARQDAVGQKCWEVLRSSLCDGSCALETCLRDATSISNKSIFIIRPDGSKVPISISAAPLHNHQGECIGGVETFRDLSAIQVMRQEMEQRYTFEDIVGKSEALSKIFRILPQVAQSPSSVLLTGESGTGKELFARALHNLSPRRQGPLVVVNCGALPEHLLESELFGYKAGAFTDAKKDKPGRFQLADGGTLFLDEIGDLPLALQVKLLRVLQEKQVEPLGAVAPVPTDVRIIAATNRDLEHLVREGRFREDLFYRLNVAQLRLPPLRERQEDIPLLANHFIRRFNLLQGKEVQGISEDALATLIRHDFPGNIRELENILEYSFILCSSGFIQLEHLPEKFHPQEASSPNTNAPMTMEEVKVQAARQALARNQGKKMAACRELDISKDTLRRLLRQG
ncbi:sigma-54 interaction domain-containing protein [Desulfohalobium retbaense]|uniref:Sigma54 specific transcriptional regulator n=1 Tax=Desulfohalobium retbaense (strain ATCC 49708 / DSM 5692 / JCM 16813 / HR100) TaxID=485915 RepID=C8X0B9_DESRD|nr:sigma 54-interacting transcriptional regulator [Desulfohalobium retbaense]ACV67744.1 putative sigma54 specific transcriptional regulator [Desulfohalobium retbaense DSM 5692]